MLFALPRDGGEGRTVIAGEEPGILADGVKAVQLVEDVGEGRDSAAERGGEMPK